MIHVKITQSQRKTTDKEINLAQALEIIDNIEVTNFK
jgi:hypothetical protein